MNVQNVEEIITVLKDRIAKSNKFRKFDGITIECEVSDLSNIDDVIIEVKEVCNTEKYIPYSVEKRKNLDGLFAIQFPELSPKYTEDEIHKMYDDDFKFLLDNIKMKNPELINKTYLIEQMDTIVKHAMKIVCKSVINQYKESYEDYYNNKKYRAKINGFYLEFLENYLNNKN